MSRQKILVVQVAALGHRLRERYAAEFQALHLAFGSLQTVFPAVTCTVQASLRTGLPPARHGILGNGGFDRRSCRTSFWDQSAYQLPDGRIWDGLRSRGGQVGMLFWQQSLGESVDMVLSPAPIHKHHGGMIQDCYARPAGLYGEVCRELGRAFNLMHYWGPLASVRSTRWIVDATLAVMQRPHAPELLLTYLPHLDYALQKHGPDNEPRTTHAVAELVVELRRLLSGAKAGGWEVVLYGDYEITPARRVVFPNRALRQAGFFAVRQVKRMTYPDLYTSRAFALVDHQVAQLFVRQPQDLGPVRQLLAELPGIDRVTPSADVLPHPQAGELILEAAPDAWFAYPWWEARCEAPDYATHVDIHSKPGYDPCELFWGWPPPSVSLHPEKVRGTHGRLGDPVAFASTFDLGGAPQDLLALAARLAAVL